jgi:hypothetical protein
MTGLDPCPTPHGRFKWGRLVSLAGAAGLCVSFFMEHVMDIVPVEGCIESVDGLWMLVSFCLPFLAAILLLPLLTFRAVPQVDGAPGVGKFLAVADCAICLSAVTIGLGWLTLLFYIPGSPVFSSFASEVPVIHAVTAVTAVSLGLAIVATVRSRLPRKAAAAQFALGASCLAYFAYFAIGDFNIHVGLWLSLAASGALTIGSAIDWFQCRPARKW